METVEAYLARKKEELELLNSFLSDPLTIRFPKSVAEVIEQKFHLAAALKAEHVLHDWALTETAWTHSGRPRSGSFEFKYDYQRADLEVRGPSFYACENRLSIETVYTASGMAAISALLMATAPVFSEADIVIMPNSYGETSELIDGHGKHLRRIELGNSRAEITKSSRIAAQDLVTGLLCLGGSVRDDPQMRSTPARFDCVRYDLFFHRLRLDPSSLEVGSRCDSPDCAAPQPYEARFSRRRIRTTWIGSLYPLPARE
jgi:hypothetical protein